MQIEQRLKTGAAGHFGHDRSDTVINAETPAADTAPSRLVGDLGQLLLTRYGVNG